jgi:hypothetical protein
MTKFQSVLMLLLSLNGLWAEWRLYQARKRIRELEEQAAYEAVA